MHLPLTIVLGKTNDTYVLNILAEGGAVSVPLDITKVDQQSEDIQRAVLSLPELTASREPPDRRIKKRSRREEEQIAKEVNGRRQKASGALPWAKGDVRKKGQLRIESKVSSSKHYIVRRKDLDKIRGECAFGEKPAFVITFVNKQTLRREDKWVLIPYEDWHEANIDS